MTVRGLTILAACAVVATAMPAAAAPATYYEVRIGDTTTVADTPGSYSSAHGSVTTQAAPMPTLSVQAAVGDAREDANAYMRYYYRINGPENVIVPVSLAGVFRVDAKAGDTAQANAQAQADLPTPFTSDFAYLKMSRGGFVSGTLHEATFDLHGSTYTNGWNSIILRAGIVTGGSRLDGASGSAFVDPVLSIDPSFFTGANAGNESLYSLSFSDGIVNGLANGVPEPTTWAMLILGFGIVGGTLRRRRADRQRTASVVA